MARFDEIQRRLTAGRTVREIARVLKVSRTTVREVRDGMRGPPGKAKPTEPLWMGQVAWAQVIEELKDGHPMKLIWEEQAKRLTTYPNFWKQFYRKFPQVPPGQRHGARVCRRGAH